MPREIERDWALIRAEYESGEGTVQALLERHGILAPTLYTRLGREGWTLRKSLRATGRPALIARLAKLLERQITHLEKNMKGNDDKEVALLGNMAKTLEKLIDLDRKQEADTGAEPRDAEMSDIRHKLVARIERLKQS